jgi:hypothetical protein
MDQGAVEAGESAAQNTPHQAQEAPHSVSPMSRAPDIVDYQCENFPVDEEGMARRARIMKALPIEILDNIMGQLDTPAPSVSKLYDEPTLSLTQSETHTVDLKSASEVCQNWRRAALRILFKHMQLIIWDPVMPKPIMRNEHLAMVDFVRRNDLKGVVKSFALCIRDVSYPLGNDTTGWIPQLKTVDFTPFWMKIFEVLDPLDVKIVCSPLVLGPLTGCEIDDGGIGKQAVGGPCHYLHLSRPLVPSTQADDLPNPDANQGQQEERAPVRYSELFECRPWTTLLLNEGNFVPAYQLEDFHHKEPYSILEDLVGEAFFGPSVGMIPAMVRDFSYVAMFPSSTHFHKLTKSLPRLDRLYTQFVPRDNTMKDEVAMSRIDPNDCWLERNSCYAYIMRELFSSPPSGNYCYLKEFESGDAADIDAWKMAVEYVKRAGGGWRVERTGVFVKDMELAAKEDKDKKDPEFEEGQVPSLLSVSGDQE